MSTVLEHIVATHRAVAAADSRSLSEVLSRAAAVPEARDLRAALAGSDLSVIAEIKRRSPSKGALAPDLDPAELARSYQRGGAAALSVLTDRAFFGGSAADLATARAAVDVPVLRKDFVVDERDVADARIMGADGILLIVAALTAPELARFRSLAVDLGMAVLVEVHDEGELEMALAGGADLIGVNQRDLHTFEVDTGRAERLAALVPDGVVLVAESGVSSGEQMARLAACGYHAVLVGESLVTAADPAEALLKLRTGGQRPVPS